MFGNAGAKPPTDDCDPPVGSVSAAPAAAPGPSSASSANSETVGHWLDQLPARSWDDTPDE